MNVVAFHPIAASAAANDCHGAAAEVRASTCGKRLSLLDLALKAGKGTAGTSIKQEVDFVQGLRAVRLGDGAAEDDDDGVLIGC